MKTTNANQTLIASKQKQIELVTNEYLQDETNPNFIYVLEKFFNTEDIDKAKLLNVGSMLFKSIADTIAFYVDKPQSEVNLDPLQTVINIFSNWYGLLWLEMSEWVLSIKNMPTKDHYYDDDLEADVIIRLYEKYKGDDIYPTKYLLQTIYYENRIENKLYELKTDSYDSGVEVELTEIKETSNLVPVEITKYKPLRTIKIDERVQYPLAEIEQIKSLVYSIDRKAVMFETQFLKNTESFILFRNIKPSSLEQAIDQKNWNVKYKQVKNDIQFTDDPQAGIDFVNNMNELIKDAIEYEQKQIRRISAITSVPTDFLWLEASHWAIWQGSRTILHGAFVKKILSIRYLFDRYLPELFDIVAKENWIEPDYSRPDVFIKDESQLIEELKVAREMNLISQKKAIMEYQWIPEDQADWEIELINEEKTTDSEINKVDFSI